MRQRAVNNLNVPVRGIANGIIQDVGDDCIIIRHEYPENSGLYLRKTKYCHLLDPEEYVFQDDLVSENQIIARIQPSTNNTSYGDHSLPSLPHESSRVART